MPDPFTYDLSELVARVARRDRAAFDALYQQLYPSLYSAAYQRVRDQDVCKDILQDVFLDLWRRAPSTSITHVQSYLHTAVRYQVFKYLARTNKHAFYEILEEMSTASPDAPHTLDYKDVLQLVELWIGTLPPKRKEIFILHYREQLTTREIAERLGLTQKSVQNQLGIAFNQLREKLPAVVFLMVLHQG